jgi:hypothetical protein
VKRSNHRLERAVTRGCSCAASALRYVALASRWHACGRPLNFTVRCRGGVSGQV